MPLACDSSRCKRKTPSTEDDSKATTMSMRPKERPLSLLPCSWALDLCHDSNRTRWQLSTMRSTADIADTAAASMVVCNERLRRAANSCSISSHGKLAVFRPSNSHLGYTLQLRALSSLHMQYRKAPYATQVIESIGRFHHPYRAEGFLRCIRGHCSWCWACSQSVARYR